jgi:2-iminobutanoate/2-iminopropanoate deaminase
MKKIINTTNAPSPIGPYSQAVIANGFMFCSGQIAIEPTTGEIINSSIEAETLQVMKNIKAVLIEANLDFSNIVKTSIFLSDMAHFAAVNDVYSKSFIDNYPARETIAVKTLPKNVNVEISVTAVI